MHAFVHAMLCVFQFEMVSCDEDCEDDDSCKAHLTVLEKELAKARPNYEVVRKKIRRTAGLRAEFMQDNTTAAIQKTYPWLKIPKLVRYVFTVTTVSFSPSFCMFGGAIMLWLSCVLCVRLQL